MSKLRKLSGKSNVLTDSQKKVIRGAIDTSQSDCCCDSCDARCGDKKGTMGAQWEALDS